MGNYFCRTIKVDEENDRGMRRCSKSRRSEKRRGKSRHRRSSDPNVVVNGEKKKKAKKRKSRNRKNSRSIGISQIPKEELSVTEGEWRVRTFREDSIGSEVYFDAEEELSDTGSDFYSDSDDGHPIEFEQGCIPALFEQPRGFFGFWGGNETCSDSAPPWTLSGALSNFIRSIWPETVPAEPVPEPVPARKISSSQWGARMRSLTRESFRQLDALKPAVGIAKLKKPALKYERAIEQKMDVQRNCWDEPDLDRFLLRGKNYLKNRKKIFASGKPVYKLVTMDIYSCPNTVDHIAERLKLPTTENIPDDCPISPLLVINWQVPMYQAKLFGGKMDGPGLCVVCIYSLDDHFDAKKEIENGNVYPQTLELLKRFCEDAIEIDGTPSRERFKMIPNVPNIHEWCNSGCFGKAEQKLLMKYHQKPMLAKPQVAYYAGPEYIEVDCNIHQYMYITRRYFHALRGTLQEGVMDMALVLEGRKSDELPEQVLAAVRLQKLDFMTEYPPVPPLPVEK